MSPPTNPTCLEQLFAILSALLMLVFPSGQPQQPLVTPSAAVYQVVLAAHAVQVDAAAMSEAAEVIANRLDLLAASGMEIGGTILSSDGDRIEIRLMIGNEINDDPEVLNNILNLLTSRGVLEFVDFAAVDPNEFGRYDSALIATSAYPDRTEGDIFPTVLMNEDIQSAEAFYNADFDEWRVQIDLTPAGAATMGTFTEANQNEGLAIVRDGVVLSIPIIQGRLTTPVVIAARFTEADAQAVAVQLNSYPLPIPLVVASVNIE